MAGYENANEDQRKAIETTEGPVLITAGPGTGKTFTLVQRTVHLIRDLGVEPGQILIATFTDKAAKELVTRITGALSAERISVNLNEMYIGTFHSICMRIIKDNIELMRLKRNYRMLDQFDQKYYVYQHMGEFGALEGFGELFRETMPRWDVAGKICGYVNNLSEELVDGDAMTRDSSPKVAAIGRIFTRYKEMTAEENLLDFSGIQVECYNLLLDRPEVLERLREKIRYLMIDEYQDTNYIQERLMFLLAGDRQNICVVGDDDQGLYRFRGATIRNILEFPDKFPEGACRRVSLSTNYRSNRDIVDFYNRWMKETRDDTKGKEWSFDWGKCRYEKTIRPGRRNGTDAPAVARITGEDEDAWHRKILAFIRELRMPGRLGDVNQIAFLCKSVKNDKVVGLANYLEKNGINVYSPRSDMFFERDEIRLALGCLISMFPRYLKKLNALEFDKEVGSRKQAVYTYYRNCAAYAEETSRKNGYGELWAYVTARASYHETLSGTADHAYSGLLYEMFQFSPFLGIAETDLKAGMRDVRPARNLALLTQIVVKYERLHSIKVLNGETVEKDEKGRRRVDIDTERLFNKYVLLQHEDGIAEYEDETDYAPKGCVSFLTIHQSKGMEFPVVIVDSLQNYPKTEPDDGMREVEERYFHRKAYEPYEDMKFFDFWRLYYVAFSRAQDVLVLTACGDEGRNPSRYFRKAYRRLPETNGPGFDLGRFGEFSRLSDVRLKQTYSFTSHIAVYETCPMQYKMYRELGFAPVRQGTIVFGTLVHETIEDIHKAALRGDFADITDENIKGWFDDNYASLSTSQHSYLGKEQLDAALGHVLRYAGAQRETWESVRQAEVDVSLVLDDYILDGRVDLIRGTDDGTVEILDFKSEKKPKPGKDARGERYRTQLETYAYLVEQRTGLKVSGMRLYYTGEEGPDPCVSYDYTETDGERVVTAFDDTVRKIKGKEFPMLEERDRSKCDNCDFRYACDRIRRGKDGGRT